MVSQSKVNDKVLGELASYFFSQYTFFSVGTGTQSFGNTDSSLNSPVEISGTYFNKVRESGSVESYVSGRNVVMLFDLDAPEPSVQPVEIGEVGLVSTVSGTVGVGSVLAKFNSPQTKDNTVRQRYRFGLRMSRLSDI